MKKINFIKKPFLLAVALIFVAAAILYIELQKPRITTIKPENGNEKNLAYPRAPDFVGIENWINSEPLKMEQLRGKVVLVDFWTYTCINCIRTLPYLKSWDEKYKDKGLVIIGIHTPEFNFEKKYENVLKAVNDYKLKYAVAQDNSYATWNAYQNRYWPHKFLIDIDGFIRYDHIGEGAYEETEGMIQALLQERMDRLKQKDGIGVNITKPSDVIDVNFGGVGTPEIYFGYQFDRGNLGYSGLKPDAVVDFKFPFNPLRNYVYLDGKWKYNSDNMELVGDDGSIMLVYKAKSVNIVAGSDNGSDIVIFVDSDFESSKNKGSDVNIQQNKSIAKINEFKLYSIVSGQGYDEHVIQIDVIGKGFKIYTFTFG